MYNSSFQLGISSFPGPPSPVVRDSGVGSGQAFAREPKATAQDVQDLDAREVQENSSGQRQDWG